MIVLNASAELPLTRSRAGHFVVKLPSIAPSVSDYWVRRSEPVSADLLRSLAASS